MATEAIPKSGTAGGLDENLISYGDVQDETEGAWPEEDLAIENTLATEDREIDWEEQGQENTGDADFVVEAAGPQDQSDANNMLSSYRAEEHDDTGGDITLETGRDELTADFSYVEENSEPQANHSPFKQGNSAGAGHTDGVGNTTGDVVDEITYEDGDEYPNTSVTEQADGKTALQEGAVAEEFQVESPQHEEGQSVYDEDAASDADHAMTEPDSVVTEQHASLADSGESGEQDEATPAEEEDVPDITVSYRDEEFPLFHGQNSTETQMGFFDDTSILDMTMDSLLLSFRQEIANDLSSQDEIVFQVDELGLEYSESTQRDQLSGVTLRQLHEIFDQLAKNQDPDATRTLYTYLIVRPNVAKRLEFLIEEAFNGSGLDEVTHPFHPGNPSRQRGVDVGNDDETGDDVEMYKESSDIAGDEDVEEEREEEGDDDDGEDDEEEEDQGYDEGEEEGGQEDDELDHSPEQQNSGGDDGSDEDFDDTLDDNDVSRLDVPSHGYQGNHNLDGGIDHTEQLVEIPPQHYETAGRDEDYHIADELDLNGEQNGLDDTYAVGDANEVADGTAFEFVDLINEDAVEETLESSEMSKVTPMTSATATLNGDEITYEEEDLGVGHVEMPSELDMSHNLDEIDWREIPDESGEGTDKTSVSGPGKRPRVQEEDTANNDDGNDAKRLRS